LHEMFKTDGPTPLFHKECRYQHRLRAASSATFTRDEVSSHGVSRVPLMLPISVATAPRPLLI
jgi:hypothetical protein